MLMRTILAVALLAAPALAAEPEQLPSVEFSATAEENYERAEKAFKDEDYLEAIVLYQHVKNRFPYSRRATDAELRLADTAFEQGKFNEAEESYRTFVKLHPGHAQVDFAAFRVGVCSHKSIPSDHFFLPPSYEKDQGEVRAAARALGDFVAAYPKSAHAAEAKELVKDCMRRLREHELYVASFYERRNKMRAAAGRLERAIADYPASENDDEVLFRLGKVYAALGEKDKARSALERLTREFPESDERGKAEELLKTL